MLILFYICDQIWNMWIKIARMIWILFLVMIKPSYQVEVSSARSRHSFNIVQVDKTAKTSDQVDKSVTSSQLPNHEDEPTKGIQSENNSTDFQPGVTEASITNASRVLVQTDNGPQYMTMGTILSIITDNIEKKIKGVPTLELRDTWNFRSACLVPELGLVLYNRRKFICCEGLHNISSQHDICCQKQVVSDEEVFCCSDKIHWKTDTNHTGCCGDRLYDPDEHICCGSRLYPRTENVSCCGSDHYDMRTQVCCFNLFVHERHLGDSCCGTEVYNSSTQACCFGNVQPAHGKNNNKGICCGVKNYHARCFRCEENGNEEKFPVPLYDINIQICCGGKTRIRHRLDTKCCGRRQMDAQTFVCINDTIQERRMTSTFTMLETTIRFKLNSSRNNLTVPSHNSDQHVSGTDSVVKVITIVIASVGGIVGFVIVSSVGICCRLKLKKRKITKYLLNNYQSTPRAPLISNNGYDNYQRQNGCFTTQSLSQQQTPKSRRSHFSLRSIHSMAVSIPLEVSITPSEDTESPEPIIVIKNDLSKDVHCNYNNVYYNHITDSCTQTPEDSVKPCNLHNTFGRPFDHTFMVDAKNPSVQMPASEEKMTLPSTLLVSNVVETHCSTFWDITEITDKFAVPKDEAIASPVAEYYLTGHRTLDGYAVVTKPFIGRPDKLKVYKFTSDHGAQSKSELIEVPKRGKQNEELDMFFETEGNLMFIYTKSFSGFLCTTCKHSRNLKLTAFLYGSYKRFPQGQRVDRYEVRLKLYIADELLTFKDFRQGMDAQENVQKRSLIAQQQLDLNDVMTAGDDVELLVDPTSEGWTNKLHPRKNTPICDNSKNIKLRDIAEQCQDCPNLHNERNMPYGIEWYLVNMTGTRPDATFQCVVEISFKSAMPTDESVAEKDNTIIIDDLTFSGTPNYHDGRITGLREFIATLEGERKHALKRAIKLRNNVVGNSVDELLDQMGRKLKIEGIVEEIYLALEKCGMDDEIRRLQELGLFSLTHIPRPTQRVDSHVQQGACCKELGEMSLNNDNRPRPNMYGIGGHRAMSESNLPCRREMSHTLTSSYSGPRELVDHRQPQRRDIESLPLPPATDLSNNTDRTPVQEHASLDETAPLKFARTHDEFK